MKKCSYCGKEHPDEASVCNIDGQPLQSVASAPPPVMEAPRPSGHPYTVKKQLTHISPLRAGIVIGILYGLLGLIFVPFFLLMAVISSRSGPAATLGGVFFAILFPVMYAVGGFIGGIIAAAIYNLVAKWTGGLEFEVRDVSRTS